MDMRKAMQENTLVRLLVFWVIWSLAHNFVPGTGVAAGIAVLNAWVTHDDGYDYFS